MTQSLKNGETLRERYQIREQIGQGGTGSIYLAEDTRLQGRLCALKEVEHNQALPTQMFEQAREQFFREASVLARLDHPNLPKVSDYFSVNKRDYLVMDYVPGKDLRERMLDARRKKEFLSEQEVISWARQIADALSYLHQQDPPIVHRDITSKGSHCNITSLIRVVRGRIVESGGAVGKSGGIQAPVADLSERVPGSDAESLTVLSRRSCSRAPDRLANAFLLVFHCDASPGSHLKVRGISRRTYECARSAGSTGTCCRDREVARGHASRGVVVRVIDPGGRRVHRCNDIRNDIVVPEMFDPAEVASGLPPVLKPLVPDLREVPLVGSPADEDITDRIDLNIAEHSKKSGAITAMANVGIRPLCKVAAPRDIAHRTATEHVDIPARVQFDISEDKGGGFVIRHGVSPMRVTLLRVPRSVHPERLR